MRGVLALPFVIACGSPDSPPDGGWADVDADVEALERVREAIAHTWEGYAAVAFGSDEARPVSGTAADWYATSMGLTLVDGWDTLSLSGLDAAADEAQAWIVSELDLDLDQSVSAFETNIRVLGGLLALNDRTGDARALGLARDLGDRLLPAFETPTGMPAKFVNLRTGAISETSDVDAAEIGTWVLEFGALSDATGDPRYREAAVGAHLSLLALADARTGLLPSGFDVGSGAVTLPLAQVGGGVDSAIEVLLKEALRTGDATLREGYDDVVGAAHRHLAETTDDGLWYGAGDYRDPDPLIPYTGALACFFPGLLALEGDLDRAVPHAEACFAAFEALGPLPDALDYRTGAVLAGNHELRPELVESLFVLYRRTGDPVWRERGTAVLDAWDACCRVERGYTVLSDVRTGTRGDGMPSFWLAESLKYLLLLFEDEGVVDLRDTVLTTEAHPLPRRAAAP